MGVFNVGIRLHDMVDATVEERIRMAGEQGFSCVHLASKVLYASEGIGRDGLTRELADRLASCAREAGVRIAVFGCYKNLVEPDPAKLAENLAEYEACLRFASWLGGVPVATETGRPTADGSIDDSRMLDETLAEFCRNLGRVCAMAERYDVPFLIEPGWNETVCSPERCREVLDRVASPKLGVLFDPVSLLHPSIARCSSNRTEKMFLLCGERIQVLHAKDYELVPTDDEGRGWCDGTGKRLVCHGAGETGNFDFSLVAKWAQVNRPHIDCVIENSTPSTAAACREYLLRF